MELARHLRNHGKNKPALFRSMPFRHSSKRMTNAVYPEIDHESITSLCKEGRVDEALHILHFNAQPVDLGPATYLRLLQACVDKNSLQEGKLVHAYIIQRGLNPGIPLGNRLVNMYVKCGSLENARKVFDKMPERDVVTWTSVISGYARLGSTREALALFREMEERSPTRPDGFIFSIVARLCAKLGDIEEGRRVHEEIKRSGLESDLFVGTALVNMYSKCGSLENASQVFDKMSQLDVVCWNAMLAGYVQNANVQEAWKLFQKMPDRDLVSWNTMIMGYAQNGPGGEALKLFQQMQEVMKPDAETVTDVLLACAGLAALEQGTEIHGMVSRSGFDSDMFVTNALVGMYSKCGIMEDARKVFDEMPQRDVVSWSTMILAYATNGYGREALQVFEKMEHSGIKPDHITFVGVLSACCHAGLVDEGLKYFENLNQCYGIRPEMAHYGCMVDLLGRAGRLDEAQQFIGKMPMKPDAAVWSSLLSACRVQNYIELAELASEHLFELEPKNPAPYVLMSNIYASAGRWDGIEKVRKMMESRNVVKQPGCSWVVVNKQIHAFFGGDRSHPQMPKICVELERLYGEMKTMGYVRDTTFALNDV